MIFSKQVRIEIGNAASVASEAAFVFAAVVALAAFIAQWYMLDPVKLATGDK